ncbi:MAG: extracellular solute-binding protein [Clostridiales bacterium]|nr:extracellular solute-binding protein [Clostridiales bacterium]
MKMKAKRMSAALLAMVMLVICLAGCGKTGADDSTGNSNSTSGINVTGAAEEIIPENSGSGDGTQPQQADGNVAMGRYVETVTDMSDSLVGFNRMYKLNDGRIIIADSDARFLISEDNGETWQEDDFAWHTKLLDEKVYISAIAFGADGTAAVIRASESNSEELGIFKMDLYIFKPDGTEIIAALPAEGDSYFRGVGVSDDGRVFAGVLGNSNVYEVKSDGSCELFVTLQESGPEYIRFYGSLMLIDGARYSAPLLYDIEKKEYVKDECLEDFINEYYPDGNAFSGEETYAVHYFNGEDGVMYIAGKKGLHRHAIGGSTVEQLIDGSLSTFGNPAYGIYGMVMLENNEFLTIFSGDRLVRYTYDANVATVPNDRLKIYSLKENDTVRQAIALYQTIHTDMAVEYEVGMETGGAATREDAIKSLNTEIMSGNGPDILILDGLPLDSYIEKGLLTDLSGILNSLSGEDEVFENIVQAMKKGDKTYAMPCEIQIPVIAGDEKYISGANDLTGIADMAEKIRADNSDRALFNIYSEKGMLRYFAMICVPAWTVDGELDRGAIEEFLTQTKRIYDAEMEGASVEKIKQYADSNVFWEKEFGETREESRYFREGINAMLYTCGRANLASGAMARITFGGYDEIHSINKVAGFEESKWKMMNGQSSNVFCAKTLLGINAASGNSAAAEEFVRLCLGKENQSTLYYGIAVNKSAFMEGFAVDESWLSEDGAYSWSGSGMTEDGIELEFETYQSDADDIAALKKCMEELRTPYIEDITLEDAVYQMGAEYLGGHMSLEEAVNEIEKKISIYMAE